MTEFLTRARERNFAVPQPAFESALDRLRNTVVNAPEPSKDNAEALAYSLYVLARNGRPVIGDLRYLSDAKLDAFPTPLAKAQLGAALAMLGDLARAGRVLTAALGALEAERDAGLSRPDYGSRLRDAAAVLTLLAEANLTGGEIESDAIARAGAALDAARAERALTSTQENAWMTLAAEGLAEHASLARFTVDGEPVKGALNRRWTGEALLGKSIAIANAGQNTAQLVANVSGAPIAPEPAASNGYAVERTFYKLDGTKIDLHSIAQNDRIVVALKVTESEARYARLLIVDRLPAGLEIDNPALVDGGLDRRLLLALERRPDAHRISRRPLCRGLRPRARTVGVHQSGLCRSRRRAWPLCVPPGDSRGHVRSRTLRANGVRRAGGHGQVRRLTLIRPHFARPPSPVNGRRDSPPLPLAGEGWDEGAP